MATSKRGPGRPSKYTDDTARMAREAYETGMTDLQVAKLLDVSRDTLHSWANTHPEFTQARAEGKELADDQVEASLFKLAIGGNLGGCIFWLRNRRPERWRLQPDESDVTDDVVQPHKVIIEIQQSGPAAQPHSPAG